jgi:hypothetical protein
MLRQQKFELETGKNQAAEEAGYQEQSEHGRKDQEKKVIGREKSRRASKNDRRKKQEPAARHSITHTAADEAAKATERHDIIMWDSMVRLPEIPGPIEGYSNNLLTEVSS